MASLDDSATKWSWLTERLLAWRTFLRGQRAFLIFCALLSILLLDFSNKIAMMNQGDYPRTIGFMLGTPIDVVPYFGPGRPAFLWPYLPHGTNPFLENNSASVYFWLLSKVERIIELNFDLYLLAFFSKAIILICCLRVALSYDSRRLPKVARYLIFALFTLAFFYSHNVAFLNSFYAEHAFVVGTAMILAGIAESRRSLRIGFLSLGLLLAAASKPQFFYLPLLFLICFVGVSLLKRKRLDPVLLCMLVIAQVVSFLPMLNATTKQVNYYHSLYFGSYKVLTPDELRSAAVPAGTLYCVGIDWWGWKMNGPGSIDIVAAPRPCPLPKDPFTLGQVLKPYLKNPFLLIRLARWSLPDHFTVHYFELSPTTSYFRPSNGTAYRNGSVLIAASNAREAVITRFWAWIVLAGIVLAFLPSSQSLELRAITLFFSLAVPTQIAVCLLGEGVRDLSKHLAGAQLCLDLVSIICLLHALSYLFRALVRTR